MATSAASSPSQVSTRSLALGLAGGLAASLRGSAAPPGGGRGLDREPAARLRRIRQGALCPRGGGGPALLGERQESLGEMFFFLREILFVEGRKREKRKEFRPNLSTSQYQEMSPERRKGHPPPLCPSF